MSWQPFHANKLCKAFLPLQQAGRTVPGVLLREGGVLESAYSCYAGRHTAVQGRAALSCLLRRLEDLRVSLSQAALDALSVKHRPGVPCNSTQHTLQACLGGV